MSSGANKMEIITFKVDGTMAEAMAGIGNRSDFIRSAILSALGNICPLCNGTGNLTTSQREHWEKFNKNHHVLRCNHCHESHIVCDLEG